MQSAMLTRSATKGFAQAAVAKQGARKAVALRASAGDSVVFDPKVGGWVGGRGG
jgi:hypothetical protein